MEPHPQLHPLEYTHMTVICFTCDPSHLQLSVCTRNVQWRHKSSSSPHHSVPDDNTAPTLTCVCMEIRGSRVSFRGGWGGIAPPWILSAPPWDLKKIHCTPPPLTFPKLYFAPPCQNVWMKHWGVWEICSPWKCPPTCPLRKSEPSKLKSIRIPLSPGSSCGLVAYTCAMVYFLCGYTVIFLLVGMQA